MKPADEELELTRLLAAEADLRPDDLALLRARGPDAAELASLSSRLALQGVDVTPPAGAPAAQLRWKKWAFGGAGAASAILLWWGLRAPQPPAIPTPAGTTAPERAQPAASLAAGEVNAKRSPGSLARAPGADAAAPASTALSGTDAASPAAAPDAATPHVTPPALPGDSGSAAPSTPIGGNHRITPSIAPAAPASSGAELAARPAAVPTEIELLRDARFALKQSPGRALELTDQHARLYPGGKLTQERELIAITALVALGRRTAALSRGAGFQRAYPRSAYIEQLNELLR